MTNTVCWLLLAAAPWLLTHASSASLDQDFASGVRPLVQQYCFECHSSQKHKGDIDLEHYTSFAEVIRSPKTWEQVLEQLSLGEMPPKQKPQPSGLERKRLLTWVNRALDEAALAHAGDPGPVVLRRLNNAEYTYTIRDLTGVETLDPAREFPTDSAAGEGFMNTGNALVMSPALLEKYFDAAKEIAAHAVLLPDGFRFSTGTTRRDWTEEILAKIRAIYGRYSEASGADKVNLQGIVFDTNEGGRLPLEKYLRATLEIRDRLAESSGAAAIRQAAAARGLSPKYLAALWEMLHQEQPSALLESIRVHWSTSKPEDAGALAQEIAQWQKVLWKFSSVGHIGKAGGPKAWMEPINPLAAKQEFRLRLSAPTNADEVVVYLAASDAGDGNSGDYVLWEKPRIVVPGRTNLLLCDARSFIDEVLQRRQSLFQSTAKCLNAVADWRTNDALELADCAARHQVPEIAVAAWAAFLGRAGSSATSINLFTNHLGKVGGYDFVRGWGSAETPSIVANSSDQPVRIPGSLPPHAVAVHPSPTLKAAVGWRSPVTASVCIEAQVTHAHPECGNGIEWYLELRRGQTRQRFAHGFAQGSKRVDISPGEAVAVEPGDLVSLLIGPRDGNHACDLTVVELTVHSEGADERDWSLSTEVADDLAEANPHPDRMGNPAVWQFYTEPASGSDVGTVIPTGSLLARWQSTAGVKEKEFLAQRLEALLTSGPAPTDSAADTALYKQLASLAGPLFAHPLDSTSPAVRPSAPGDGQSVGGGNRWALESSRFGKHPNGTAVDAASLCVQAPSLIEVHLPAELVDGAEWVTTGVLESAAGGEGSVQLQVTLTPPLRTTGLMAGQTTESTSSAPWTSDRRQISYSTPIVVNENSAARRRIESEFDAFRRWFPAALCYQKIVPVDEVITSTLFHREDEPLCRLLLEPDEKAKLDRLWDELHFVSRDALTRVDVFEQLWQYATQDADPKVFEPLRKPINEAAARFKQQLVDTQPQQVQAVLDFAARAYRQPLTQAQAEELRALYRRLRQEEISHEEAFQLTLARVFVAPTFLYRLEDAAPGPDPGPVSDYELATRLSYFLWSSAPDDELCRVAAAGRLHEGDMLAGQTRRMLQDGRVRRLAKEFGCAWLHLYDFAELNEKSERHFPTFAQMRGPMNEEVIRFFTDLFQTDASILTLIDCDHSFMDQALAEHYGIPGVQGGWQRVDGVKKFGRGGVLGFGATLAKESGASRTSPILRGNWVAEVLLGDKLPRPPKDVPRLPEDEATETLTVRQLVEKHSSDPRCANCHVRIDGYGFALEGYDAIGRMRSKDLADRPIDSSARVFDGSMVEGAAGLRRYLLEQKRDVIVRQFCRKLLGYALGRGVILADKPLIAEMQRQLEHRDYHFSAAVQAIVQSRQFRDIRGHQMADAQ